MTTTVTIEANCSDDLEVEVTTTQTGIEQPQVSILEDGETKIDHVYDDKTITVRERPKGGG